MPITVLHVPFHYRGSTKELFLRATETMKGKDYSGILYLSPTYAKIREAQTIFHEVGGDCYIPPVMTTIRQLSIRIFSAYARRKLISSPVIPVVLSKSAGISIGYACLIAHFIHEMQQRYPGKAADTIAGDIGSLCHSLGIPEEVSLRAVDALKIMNDYRRLLEHHGAADEDDAVVICPQIIRTHKTAYQRIIVDGFIELTVAEQALFQALIAHADETYISVPYDFYDNNNLLYDSYINYIKHYFIFNREYLHAESGVLHLPYTQYPSSEEEIEGIARIIKNRFLSGSLIDLEKVIVAFPNMSRYADMVSRVFGKYGIPFTFSSGRTLAMKRPYRDLLALLESIANDYPRMQFAQFLVSPFFKALAPSLREYIPTLSISTFFAGGKSAWLDIMRSNEQDARRDHIGREAADEIVHALTWVFQKLSPLESARTKASFATYGAMLLDLLNDLMFDDEGNHNLHVRTRTAEIINDLSFLDRIVGPSPTDLRSFTEAMRHCLMNTDSAEPDNRGVQIMSIAEAEGLEPEHAFVAGLRDGDFPARPGIDYLLPDNLRTRLGIVHADRYLLRQKFLFRRVLSSARGYTLSYSTMDGDRLYLPSSFLSRREKSAHPTIGIFSWEEDLIRLRRKKSQSLISETRIGDRRLIRTRFGANCPIRVTDIDAYRTCPRRFFLEKVLCLKPKEIPAFELEALTLGTVVHEIMQEIQTSPLGDLDTFMLGAGRKIDEVLSRKRLDDYWANVVRETIYAILPQIYAIEQKIAAEGFAFAGAEVPITGEIVPGIVLKGKIDRIDRLLSRQERHDVAGDDSAVMHAPGPDGLPLVALIDYKTGSTQFSGSRILNQGASLQLLLYAALIRAQGMLVERVGIYSLKDVAISWIPGRQDKKNGRTIDHYIDASIRFLEETVSHMREGEFPSDPLNDQICRNCHERPYCPYIQKTVTR